jgi:hypothetical protein
MTPLYEYIQGIAGTGKTWLLKEKAAEDPAAVLCATTGIAAVNLGEGTTIHSFLWFYNTDSLLDAWTTGKLDYRMGEVYGNLGIRRILLDEISMLPASNLSVLCLAVERLNQQLREKRKQELALTLAGDFAQLPPVEGEFAFESEHWQKFAENTIILRHIYRQEDKEFIEALQAVREGKGKEAVDFFEPFMNRTVDAHYDGTTVYPYNKQVDAQNAYRLSLLNTKRVSFSSNRTGKPRPEWKHIPQTLDLKHGALVMILANKRNKHTGKIIYANGDLGSLVMAANPADVSRAEALVKLHRGGEVLVETVERTNIQPVNGEKTLVGRIEYMPLRLAWASTVHKSQGLTLDNIQVDFRSQFFAKTPGMLYVGLSRARTKGGLRLIGGPKTFIERCTVNPKIRRFL